MAIRIVQLEERPRRKREGLRIGAVRRVPMRKPKGCMYDIWLPELAPSQKLRDTLPKDISHEAWERFLKHYRREMKKPPSNHVLDFVAALSHETDLTVGCYCADEARCHRSALRELLIATGAAVRI